MTAFPSEDEGEVVQRLKDNALRYRRTVERFGYLGTRECSSKYFNITSARSRRAPSAPTLDPARVSGRIHCYGGSTTHGVNVGDEETWPHLLEVNLRKVDDHTRVLNFGAGAHTSLHSSLHLLDHCLQGRVPTVAIFFNGLNDCIYAHLDPDGALPFLDLALELSQHEPGTETPIGELTSLIPRMGEGDAASMADLRAAIDEQDVLDLLRERFAVAAGIRDLCARQWGVHIVQFWEPTPFVACRLDQELVPRLRDSSEILHRAAATARLVARVGVSEVLQTDAIVDLTSFGQDQLEGPLFLDEYHATPRLNCAIATQIGTHLEGGASRPSRRARLWWPRAKDNVSRARTPQPPARDDLLYPLW
jgi:hypothetical protein